MTKVCINCGRTQRCYRCAKCCAKEAWRKGLFKNRKSNQKKKWKNLEFRAKHSEACKKAQLVKWKNEVYREKQSAAILKGCCTQDSRIKNSIGVKRKWKDANFRIKQSNAKKNVWNREGYKAKISIKQREITVKRLEDLDKRKNWMLSFNKLPNKLEISLLSILRDSWIYTGDFKFFVGYKNPDFKHKQLKLLIELFGDYWHRNDDGKARIEHFRKHGYETLIIWEHELKNSDQVLAKVAEFVSSYSQQSVT